MIRRFRWACLLFCLLTLSAGVVAAAPVVLFDQAHGQHFLPSQNGPLDLSGLAEQFKAAGYDWTAATGPLTAERLAGVDALVISGAFLPLSVDEVRAVSDFLAQGGGVAVMLHIAPPLKGLLHHLEVDFSNGTLREQQQMIGSNPLDFRVADLSTHPLTENLDAFAVYGAWALRATADNVRVIARTSPQSWVDLDRNDQLSAADAVQAFGLIAVGQRGLGKFAVFGDDALFQNRFLDQQNRQLAGNLAEWLKPAR